MITAPLLAIVTLISGGFLVPLVGLGGRRRAVEVFSITVLLASSLFVVSIIPGALSGEILVYGLEGFHAPVGIVLVVDGLNLLLGLMVSIGGLLVGLYSIPYIRQHTGGKMYYSLYLLMIAGLLGIVFTGDLFNMYVFLEIASISAYALVSMRKESLIGGMEYLITSSLGTSFVLIAIALLYGFAGTLNMADLGKIADSTNYIIPVTLAFLVSGIGVKIAMIPFHAWKPDAMENAPASVNAILGGVSNMVGIYAILRIVFIIYYQNIQWLLLVLGVLAMFGGALLALMQENLNRLLAYSGISQAGYILAALGLGGLGYVAGIFQLLNLGIIEVLLFLCAGVFLWHSSKEGLNITAVDTPITTFGFIVGGLALVGIPPFNGFVSKWLIYVAGIREGMAWFTVLALVVSALTLVYFLKALNILFFKRGRAKTRVVEPSLVVIPILILTILCVFIGVFPDSALNYVDAAVRAFGSRAAYIGAVL